MSFSDTKPFLRACRQWKPFLCSNCLTVWLLTLVAFKPAPSIILVQDKHPSSFLNTRRQQTFSLIALQFASAPACMFAWVGRHHLCLTSQFYIQTAQDSVSNTLFVFIKLYCFSVATEDFKISVHFSKSSQGSNHTWQTSFKSLTSRTSGDSFCSNYTQRTSLHHILLTSFRSSTSNISSGAQRQGSPFIPSAPITPSGPPSTTPCGPASGAQHQASQVIPSAPITPSRPASTIPYGPDSGAQCQGSLFIPSAPTTPSGPDSTTPHGPASGAQHQIPLAIPLAPTTPYEPASRGQCEGYPVIPQHSPRWCASYDRSALLSHFQYGGRSWWIEWSFRVTCPPVVLHHFELTKFSLFCLQLL